MAMDQYDCPSGPPFTCTVTLTEDSSSNTNITWSVSDSLVGVSFSPSSGTLTPGGSPQQVSISNIPCQNDTFTFTDNAGLASPLTVNWSCQPTPTPDPTPVPSPTFNVSSTNLDPSTCPWHSEAFLCTVTLTEDASAQGNLTWTASSTGSANITPLNGTLTPGQSMQVSIFAGCDTETITFVGPGNTVSATWSCPTVTVTPTALSSTSSSCSLDSTSNTYTCSVTLTESANFSVNAHWIADSGGSGVQFSPASSGTLSPGQSITVQIINIPCQNLTFSFYAPYNQGGNYLPVSWTCP